jgi:hypothetical protein
MSAVCLLVAGALQAAIPGDRFTVAWRHSVTHTRWEEDYRVRGDRLVAEESRIEGSGAGMEPPENARFAGGMWRWRPPLAPLPELRLTLSPYTADYRFCVGGRCTPLHALVHAAPDVVEVVAVRPCPVESATAARRRGEAAVSPPRRGRE